MAYSSLMLFSFLLLALQATAQPNLDQLRAIAALPGEPSIVSAAGVRKDESPVLTLENPDAFDITSAKRRAVIFSSGATGTEAAAVLRMVAWFKTKAPQALRDQWSLSALPSATFDPADQKSAALSRWMNFQAPDAVIELVEDGQRLIGPGDVLTNSWVIHLPASDDAIGGTLRAAKPGHSQVAEVMRARIGRDPLTLAKLLAKRYPETPSISYIPSVAWTQTLRLADVVKDDALKEKVKAQTQPWVSGEKKLFGDRIQLTAVAGTMVFGDLGADALFEQGVAAAAANKADGVAEYGQGWTDDMFMGTVILARAGARPGGAQYFDVAANRLIAYAGKLQQPSGLFNHATDGPAAWGRGNGFAALGLVELLTRMPESHRSRAQLLDIYRRQMTAVRAQQAPDGAWREIIDEPGAYREESATAMLMTAMARGIRLGWLDRSYEPIVQRAWRALAAHVAEDGTIVDICTNTGAGPTKRYYFDRQAVTGADDRGGAMALLGALEFYELGAR